MAATFVVEDGTGLPTSNSYLSVASANQYHEDHGDPDAWTGLGDGEKKRHLREATEYLDATFRSRWRGIRGTNAQALDHPRDNLNDREGFLRSSSALSIELVPATALMALKSAEAVADGSELAPDLANPGSVKKTRKKLDVLEEEIEYESGNQPFTRYRRVDMILGPILLRAGLVQR